MFVVYLAWRPLLKLVANIICLCLLGIFYRSNCRSARNSIRRSPAGRSYRSGRRDGYRSSNRYSGRSYNNRYSGRSYNSRGRNSRGYVRRDPNSFTERNRDRRHQHSNAYRSCRRSRSPRGCAELLGLDEFADTKKDKNPKFESDSEWPKKKKKGRKLPEKTNDTGMNNNKQATNPNKGGRTPGYNPNGNNGNGPPSAAP